MLIDLHTHTHPGSWDSFLKADEMVERCKAAGLDGMVLSEHDWAWDLEEAKRIAQRHEFLVIPAMELNTEDGHFLVYGMHKYVYGMHRSHELAEHVREAGGIMVAAHPYRRQHPWNWESVKEWADALERAERNGGFRFPVALEVGNGRGKPNENSFSNRLQELMGFPGTAGSDSHAVADIGKAATYFERDIRGEQDLIEELRAGRCWPIDRTGGTVSSNPDFYSVPDDLHDRWAELAERRREYIETHPLHRRD